MTGNPYTAARLELTTAYVAAGLTAFGYTPATVRPPVVVVEPANDWITPNRIGSADARVGFTVSCYASLIDSTTALDTLEQLVADVIRATPSGVLIDSVTAPAVDGTSSSQGDVLVAELTLTAQVKE